MKIHIKRYPVYMKIGCLSQEQIYGQEVLVSLQIASKNLVQAGQRDELEEGLDYGKLMSTIDQLLEGSSLKLLETAVLNLGQGLLSQFRLIETLDVLIEKPILPQGIAKGASVSVSHTFCRIS